jgi:predicted metal-binding membrane protein
MAAGHSGYDGTMNTINNCDTGLKRDWAFRIASALLFIASAARTIYGERSMSSGMAMPGGWTMSMASMRIEGQSWLAAIFAFMGMWVVTMAAMMLPALVPCCLSSRANMLGAIEKKILAWHTGFWGKSGTNGWCYDTMLVVMNLVIVTTGGGNLTLSSLFE